MNKIVVGISGGVDSSVSAYLLKSQGFDVIGLFMKNWDEEDEDEGCSSAQDYEDVMAVCEFLDIPYYTVSFVKEYKNNVFADLLEGYSQGYTPNPDVLCNSEIKFKLLLKKAEELGGYLATGHYCRKTFIDGNVVLMKAKDLSKDQSYFLSITPGNCFRKVLFPLGDLLKSEVRKIASEAGISTATKKDSTGICFIGKRNFKNFLGRYLPEKQGLLIDWHTKSILGQHPGAHFFTIGQRKGLEIGGPGGPWYVVGKDMNENIIYVVNKKGTEALLKDQLTATDVNWFSKPKFPYECTAKIRYRSEDEPCYLTEDETNPKNVKVVFQRPISSITPRQTIVFYSGDFCLGGGSIDVSILPMSPVLP
ncbi:MAG: tRNA 2-thiouridine(34) synthase MnmA [Victivallaceae bacterium]